jgi:predicted TIM-barrel fold metal-dependent hydrolase
MAARKQYPFPVVDVDAHVYEPESIWERYVPVEYRAAARSAFFHSCDDRGNAITILNGSAAPELNRTKIVRQAVWRPGTTAEDIGRLDPNVFHPLNPGAADPEARLADLDTLGIDQQVIFPTLFAEYFPLVENPDAARMLARAYNDWIFDFCQVAPDRLHPVAVLPLGSILFACQELERIAAKGFKAVFLRPLFYTGAIAEERGLARVRRTLQDESAPGMRLNVNRRGAFLTHPNFEPLWREIDQARLVACIHPSQGSTSPEGASAGTFIERVAKKLAIGHNVAEAVAYMQDTGVFLSAAAFTGLMEDLPNLRIALLHSGASMIPLILEKAETYLWLQPGNVLGVSPAVSLEPHEVFARHPALVSFDGWESPVAEMPDLFLEKAAWGSRYPHHDASDPAEALGLLERHSVPQETVERLMGRNAIEFFQLDASASSAHREARAAR